MALSSQHSLCRIIEAERRPVGYAHAVDATLWGDELPQDLDAGHLGSRSFHRVGGAPRQRASARRRWPCSKRRSSPRRWRWPSAFFPRSRTSGPCAPTRRRAFAGSASGTIRMRGRPGSWWRSVLSAEGHRRLVNGVSKQPDLLVLGENAELARPLPHFHRQRLYCPRRPKALKCQTRLTELGESNS